MSRPVSPVVPVDDLSGLYVGIGAGWMRLSDSYTKEYFETYPIMLQAGYKYNKYLSLEARYIRDARSVKYENGNTNNPDDNDFPTHFESYGFYLKPTYPIDDFSLYLLAGYGEVSLNLIEGANRKEKSIQYGAGVSYKVARRLEVFADYTRLYDGDGFQGRAKARNVHADSVIVGVSYAF